MTMRNKNRQLNMVHAHPERSVKITTMPFRISIVRYVCVRSYK